MTSVYPGGLDSFETNRTDATVMASVQKSDHNNYADAINKIEATLGVDPQGSFGTVVERLDNSGSQPLQEYLKTNMNTDDLGTFLPWTRDGFAGGDVLLDLTDPNGPIIIGAGCYCCSVYVSVPFGDPRPDGTQVLLDFEIDSNSDADPDVINSTSVVSGQITSVSGSITAWVDAGAVMRAQYESNSVVSTDIRFVALLVKIA